MSGPSPEQHIYRDRISHEMAFPLGYERLAQAFGDLPQFSDFEFWFSARPVYWASDFTRTVRAQEPYPIVEVRQRYMSPGFSLRVYPVVRPLKSIAREAFLSSALEPFRHFILLRAAAPSGDRDFRRAFFDPVVHTCTVSLPTPPVHKRA